MADLGEPLSRREQDVLQAMAHGASNKEIATKLVISPNTVKVHVRNIFTKMGATSRTEATTLAIQQGLLVNGQENGELTVPTVETKALDSEEAVSAETDPTSAESEPTTPESTTKSNRLPYLLVAILGIVAIAALLYYFLQQSNRPIEQATPETYQNIAMSEPGWFETRPLPEPRSGMALISIGPDIYSLGGENPQAIDGQTLRLDTRSGNWHQLAEKPTAVTNAGAAIAVGQIFVIGGETADGATSVVEAYSPSSDGWRSVASLPIALSNATVVSSGERIFLFGGESNGEVSDAAFVYDPLEDSWRPLPAMQTSRSRSAGALLDNDIYILGGFDGQAELRTCERFTPDATDESWSECPDMLEARADFQAVRLARKFYIVGGGSTGSIPYGEVYDSESDTWQVLNVPVHDSADNWLDLGMAVVETRIYLLGGEHNSQLQDKSYFYNALENRIFIPQATNGE